MLRSIALPIGISLYITGNHSQSIVVGEFASNIQSHGAHVTRLDLNASISDTSSNIKNASMFVCYIGNNNISPQLYIEIGIAIAHKKIIYIVGHNDIYHQITDLLNKLQYKSIHFVSNITIVT